MAISTVWLTSSMSGILWKSFQPAGCRNFYAWRSAHSEIVLLQELTKWLFYEFFDARAFLITKFCKKIEKIVKSPKCKWFLHGSCRNYDLCIAKKYDFWSLVQIDDFMNLLMAIAYTNSYRNSHFHHYFYLLLWVNSKFSSFWYKMSVFWQNTNIKVSKNQNDFMNTSFLP